MAIAKVIYKSSPQATGEVWMDATTATATAEDIIAPKTAMIATGVMTEGTGSGGSSKYTATITGTGNSTYTYVTFDSVKYYEAGSFEFEGGEELSIRVANGETNTIIIDGAEVEKSTTSGPVTYTLILPTNDISIKLSGTGQAGGSISVTTNEHAVYENKIIARTISGTYENSRITTIGNHAFGYCSSLEYVSFPNCTSIGQYGFANCQGLKSISFPNCLTVGTYAFMYCFSLKHIYLPNCEYLQGNAFYSCMSLSSIELSKCSSIGANVFNGCNNLRSVNLPMCSNIAYNAFANCISLSSVVMPNCEMIGSSAFFNCSIGLKSVSYPLCSSIYSGAFRQCWSLQKAYFPNCSIIGSSVFYGCSRLSEISFPRCNTIHPYAFTGCSVLGSICLPRCYYIGAYAFSNCYSLSMVVCSHSSTDAYIYSYSAFQKCYNLLSLYLLGSVIYSLSNTNAFISTPISNYTTSTGGVYGSIFVPASLYDSYISATNWATYSSRFASITNSEIAAQFPYGVSTSGEVIGGQTTRPTFGFDGVPVSGETYHLYFNYQHKTGTGSYYRSYIYDDDITWNEGISISITSTDGVNTKTLTLFADSFNFTFDDINDADLYEITISSAT